MNRRVKRIFDRLTAGVDLIVIANDVDPMLDLTFYYATGAASGIFEGCAALMGPRRVEILSSPLEAESARKTGLPVSVVKDAKDWQRVMERKLKGARRIGINPPELSHRNYQRLRRAAPSAARFVDVSKAIRAARLVKDADEIARIRAAARIVSSVAEAIPDFVHLGMSENEAAAELAYRMQKQGAEGPSFPAIVAFGPNSAEPHYRTSSSALKRGQFAVFDFGASVRRYASDITRTFVTRGFTRRHREIYELVREAQQAALDTVAAGVSGKAVDRAARQIIDRSKYRGRFVHRTGHSLGLAVHDPGSLAHDRSVVLEEGMVFTIEPGVYVPGFGGVRIEDDILVTKKGCELLTSARRELTVLDAA